MSPKALERKELAQQTFGRLRRIDRGGSYGTSPPPQTFRSNAATGTIRSVCARACADRSYARGTELGEKRREQRAAMECRVPGIARGGRNETTPMNGERGIDAGGDTKYH